MSETSDGPGVSVDRLPPERAFALLGDETRVRILRALSETPTEPTSFSALRERVGAPDSGRFNYHLSKLVGHFVRRSDEGYELTLAGMQVVGALLAGTYTAEATTSPIDVDDPCPECDERPLVAEYEDEHVRIGCPACEEWYNRFSFPPGAVDQYDREELPVTFDRWMRTVFARIVAGFCHTCAGRLSGRLLLEDGESPRVEYRCDRCGDVATGFAALPVYYHAAALGFYADHGIDAMTTPSWRVTARHEAFEITTVSEDPPAVRVEITVDGETLVAHVDATATVTAVERTAG
ncbi:winged helix-turn-helix domain-containing protein [Halomarina pelagica]|uniref:winged helix-turn-helix domain-containing protein n=1 Tax=Halomarina pelagica TaxID=2961599 RepID=UPI0020C209F7|nr:winged helix-turn-helix domain-containing protein [Halomarina sp. BND7]